MWEGLRNDLRKYDVPLLRSRFVVTYFPPLFFVLFFRGCVVVYETNLITALAKQEVTSHKRIIFMCTKTFR